MELHGDKFEHLHYSCRQRQNIDTPTYTSSSGSTITEKPSVEKDLGVIMSSDGTFKKHIEEVVREARSQAAWVLRTFSTRDKIPMTTLFKAL